jgi:4-carboxymuconolactone decarboxylase
MNEHQQICYDFPIELHRNKRISDVAYARGVKRLGEKGRSRLPVSTAAPRLSP